MTKVTVHKGGLVAKKQDFDRVRAAAVQAAKEGKTELANKIAQVGQALEKAQKEADDEKEG